MFDEHCLIEILKKLKNDDDRCKDIASLQECKNPSVVWENKDAFNNWDKNSVIPFFNDTQVNIFAC